MMRRLLCLPVRALALLVTLGLILAATPSCRTRDSTRVSSVENVERRAGRELVVVFVPDRSQAHALVRALRSELAGEFDVHAVLTDRTTGEEFIAEIMRQERPSAVVLIDNPTVRIYGKWARRQQSPPPSLIVMASFASQLQKLVPNSLGISFEPPAVTSLSALRRVLDRPIERVGMVYRAGFEAYMRRETERAALEQITLVAVRVPKRATPVDVHRALEKLRDDAIDALWVSNDNALLSSSILQDAWFPFVERHPLPVVVGAPSLLDSKRGFGTFAVVPDVDGIGVQAADAIVTLADDDWVIRGAFVQAPVSVRTLVDLKRARRLGLSPRGEHAVDVLVGER